MVRAIKAFAIVNKGFEQECSDELKNLGATNCEEQPTYVLFEVENYEKLCSICYLTRSANKILLFLAEFSVENFENAVKKEIEKIESAQFVNKETTFAVDYEKTNDAQTDGRIIAGEIGGAIQEKTGAKVNLSNPDIPFFCWVTAEKCVLGIDFSGGDLGKRDYRIFLGRENLKGNVGFCLLQMAKYAKEMLILDPFCRSGVIAIEAALYSKNKSPHFFNKNQLNFQNFWFLKEINFEKMFAKLDTETKKTETKIICTDEMMPNVMAARKNAKIAGVLDEIDFSRTEMEWMDLKLEENSIDRIITFPPQISKISNLKKIEKNYEWLFKNASKILKKTGKVLLVCNKKTEEKLKEYAEKNKFLVERKKIFYQGGDELRAVVYSVLFPSSSNTTAFEKNLLGNCEMTNSACYKEKYVKSP